MPARVIPQCFSWLKRHSWLGWLILFFYAMAVTFPHEEVQGVVGTLAKTVGRLNLYRLAGALALGLGALLTAVMLPELRRHPQRRVIVRYWVITLLLIVAAWATLTANNTELAHYPQYFVPGALLMAITLSPLESLAWVILTGSFDEGFQYWGLHGGWGVPFDFNDVFMDFLGGALGIVFALVFLRSEAAAPRSLARFLRDACSKAGAFLLALITLSGLVMLAAGKMLLYQDESNHSYWFALSRLPRQVPWFFDETWGPKHFHILSPIEGPVVLLLALVLYALLDWNWRFSPRERD